MSDSYQAIYDAVRSRISGGNISNAVDTALRDAFGNIDHHFQYAAQDFACAASEQQRPCVLFKPELSLDGDMYCTLFGKDLVQGVAGFGKSAAEAMTDFDKNWYVKMPTKEPS
jgi:hypothetical protein